MFFPISPRPPRGIICNLDFAKINLLFSCIRTFYKKIIVRTIVALLIITRIRKTRAKKNKFPRAFIFFRKKYFLNALYILNAYIKKNITAGFIRQTRFCAGHFTVF